MQLVGVTPAGPGAHVPVTDTLRVICSPVGLMVHIVYVSCGIYSVLTPSQIFGHFNFFRFIDFATHVYMSWSGSSVSKCRTWQEVVHRKQKLATYWGQHVSLTCRWKAREPAIVLSYKPVASSPDPTLIPTFTYHICCSSRRHTHHSDQAEKQKIKTQPSLSFST
jgi:hypothetical protein